MNCMSERVTDPLHASTTPPRLHTFNASCGSGRSRDLARIVLDPVVSLPCGAPPERSPFVLVPGRRQVDIGFLSSDLHVTIDRHFCLGVLFHLLSTCPATELLHLPIDSHRVRARAATRPSTSPTRPRTPLPDLLVVHQAMLILIPQQIRINGAGFREMFLKWPAASVGKQGRRYNK